MALLYATRALRQAIGMRPAALAVAPEPAGFFDGWYAHFFEVAGKFQLLFVHQRTLFAFFSYDSSVERVRQCLPRLFATALAKALYVEGVSAAAMRGVARQCAGELRLGKAQDRRALGVISSFVRYARSGWSEHPAERESLERFMRFAPAGGFPDRPGFEMPLAVFFRALYDEFQVREVPQWDDFFCSLSGSVSINPAVGFEHPTGGGYAG